MSIRVGIDLAHPLHMRAFAKFLTDVADARDAKIAEAKADQDRRWSATETPAEAPAEPEQAAPAAPAEKPKRTRKKADAVQQVSDVMEVMHGKDAPAASVSSDDTPAISGEERIGPEDSPETIAQDAADEKAETEAARDPANPLTLDDVRTAMGAYAQAYGMDMAMADGPSIFNKALGAIPEGTKNAKGDVVTEWCLTATPTDQASLGKAVQYWQAALTENPFKRSKVAA